jgi:rhamnosyl/mannosyltransferase
MNLYKPLLRSFFKRMDLIIVPSRSFLNSKLLSGFEGKTEIIPFGIDMKKFELTQEVREIRDKIKKEYGFPILLFVGNLLPYKGLYYLIKAMREINGNLLIIGDGPQRKELVELTQKYGLIKKVHFLGRKSFEELIYFYHACDVFVLPSLYESFGNVQLEAMACGKPVVNTNIPTGVPEVSIHEQTGLTVPPEDSSALSQAINRLIENHEERIRYGEKARERVKNFFSIESVSEKILSLYEKLLL